MSEPDNIVVMRTWDDQLQIGSIDIGSKLMQVHMDGKLSPLIYTATGWRFSHTIIQLRSRGFVIVISGENITFLSFSIDGDTKSEFHGFSS